MDNDADIGLVNTHAKRIGGYHHTGFSCQPTFLSLVFDIVVETGMIEGSGNLMIDQELCYFPGTFAVAGIDNGRPFYPIEDMKKFFLLVLCLPDNISQVFPLETHSERLAPFFKS